MFIRVCMYCHEYVAKKTWMIVLNMSRLDIGRSCKCTAKRTVETKLLVSFVSALGCALSLSSAAQAQAAVDVSTVENEPGDHTTKLRSLQAGARRAQLERFRNAQGNEGFAHSPEATAPTPAIAPVSPADGGFSASDGVYLYGEQPVRDQISSAYFVFQTDSGTVTGAFYTASSSFDCAQGHISQDRLQLTITESYSQQRYPYALNLVPVEAQIASTQEGSLPVGIEGFYSLPLSEVDHAILSVCQMQQN